MVVRIKQKKRYLGVMMMGVSFDRWIPSDIGELQNYVIGQINEIVEKMKLREKQL